MFLIMLADETIQEVPNVTEATIEHNCLICYDQRGAIVARYEPREVIAFGHDGTLLDIQRARMAGQPNNDGMLPPSTPDRENSN